MEFQIQNNLETEQLEPQVSLEEHDSTSSTPYASAPSSPGPGGCSHGGFFYSAPTSPMHFKITSSVPSMVVSSTRVPSSSEFEFSARFGSSGSGQIASSMMTSADELFLNGQIRPLKEKSQVLVPVGRRRRTRSLSSSRNVTFGLDDQVMCSNSSSSSSSSSSKNKETSSKKWCFLKRFIKSKSEGRSNNNAQSKEKKKQHHGPVNGIENQRRSKKGAVELHYTANRAEAEAMRKRTFLPYRQGLLGCLGFSSKGYGAMNGLATRTLNPVSSS